MWERSGTALVSRSGSGSPWFWFLALGAGASWIAPQVAGWTLYPGHWALAALLAVLMWRTATLWAGLRPLKWALALCGYLVLMALIRGEWTRAATVAGATAANVFWAAGAYHLGKSGRKIDALIDGVVLFAAAALPVELLLWAGGAYFPQVCLALNCPERGLDLLPFRGGLASSGQYAVLLALTAPIIIPAIVLTWRDPAARIQRIVLAVIGIGSGLGVVAGAGGWWIPMALLLFAGLYRLMGRPRDLATVRFFKSLAIGMVAAPLVLYAVFPGYLERWLHPGSATGGRVQILLTGPATAHLTSVAATPLTLRVTNAGTRTLAPPLRLLGRVMITPVRGVARVYEGQPVVLTEPLRSGKSIDVTVPVRLPHFVRGGFLAWRIERADGTPIALTRDSDHGFRFVNTGYRPLTDETDNVLSALAQRARDFRHKTFVPASESPSGPNFEKILGGLLDTLLFSPLWGEVKNVSPTSSWTPPRAFHDDQPFFPLMFSEYGAIGLILILWLLWTTARKADAVGTRISGTAARLGWQLVPVSILMLIVLAIFSTAPGSHHVQWGVFMLIGFVAGRYERLYPARPRIRGSRTRWLRLGIPRPRLSWPFRRKRRMVTRRVRRRR